jgi:hypothetical protein
MNSILNIFSGGFNFTFGNYVIPFTYLQVGAIAFLIFLLILMLAQFRRHYVDWSFKGVVFGVFFGFLLALTLEGFLIISGRTALTSLLGWKNAPAPISLALDSGRAKLIEVLGVQTQIPTSHAKGSTTVQDAVETLQSLTPADLKKVKALFCSP